MEILPVLFTRFWRFCRHVIILPDNHVNEYKLDLTTATLWLASLHPA